MKVELKGKDLVITIPFDAKGKPSASGKSIVHSSTSGNKPTDLMIGDKPVIVGLNVYTQA